MLSRVSYALLKPILDFVYPPVCFVCDELLTEGEHVVCLTCWNSFSRITSTHPTWVEIGEKFATEGVVDGLLSWALFEKEGRFQEVIHLLKYQGIQSVGVRFGQEIGRLIADNAVFSEAEYVIPVPLHKVKKRERGYNQSELICAGISGATGITSHPAMMIRKKYTQTQTKLDVAQRKENVADAFIVNPKFVHDIRGKTFILVDDLITTGSTINACAKVLKENGAVNVYAASVALAR
jgi:ComF family protein